MHRNFLYSVERDMYLKELKISVLKNEDVNIPGEYQYLVREWKRSAQLGVPQNMDHLSENTRDLQVFERISDFDKYRLAYMNDYYNGRDELLGKLGCAIYYTYDDLSVYRKAGDNGLLAELRSHGLRLGSNLSEKNIGVSPASLAQYSQGNIVSRFGSENYAELFSKYACYGLVWHENQRKNKGLLLVVTPLENCSELVQSSIEFLLTIEHVTHDIYYPFTRERSDLLEAKEYNSGSLELYLDEHGDVVFASKHFEDIFGKKVTLGPLQGIGQFMPELSYLVRFFDENIPCRTREVMLLTAEKKNGFFLVSPKIIKTSQGKKGLHCTLQHSVKEKKAPEGVGGCTIKYNFDSIIGRSRLITELKDYAMRAAENSSNILILGESGTGKELFAQAIHSASLKKDGPFVPINCAAISKELLYSELFGYEDGAFTGAAKGGSAGKFEQASGGTIFLDEIGDMPLDMQSSLLRILEDSMVVRVGGKKFIPVDVRVIAATNQDLWKKVQNGDFRADLYFRLNIVTVKIPPLRERPEDLEPLIEELLKNLCRKNMISEIKIAPELIKLFRQYSWPGNVRELRNVIERCVNCSDTGVISPENLPQDLLETLRGRRIDAPVSPAVPSDAQGELNWRGYDRMKIIELMKKHNGNKTKVAGELGISRATFYKRLNEYGIK